MLLYYTCLSPFFLAFSVLMPLSFDSCFYFFLLRLNEKIDDEGKRSLISTQSRPYQKSLRLTSEQIVSDNSVHISTGMLLIDRPVGSLYSYMAG